MKCFFVFSHSKKWNIRGILSKCSFQRVDDIFLKRGPDIILGFKNGKNAQNCFSLRQWGDYSIWN
jgi:hypothetical protein